MAFATTMMDLENVILNEVRKRKIPYKSHDITYMWNLIKNDTKELIYKRETNAQISKPNLWLPKGKLWSGDKWGEWDWHIHTTLCRIHNWQGPAVYSIEKSTQHSSIIYMGKKNGYICICITDSLCYIP